MRSGGYVGCAGVDGDDIWQMNTASEDPDQYIPTNYYSEYSWLTTSGSNKTDDLSP